MVQQLTKPPERPVTVIYRTSAHASLRDLTLELLETAELEKYLPTERDAAVGLKPNLVAARPAEGGATTHPQIVEGLIIYLQGRGFRRLTILEGSWTGADTDEAYTRCGYRSLARTYGVELINTQKDRTVTREIEGFQVKLCRSLTEMDFLINLPVLKGHCQTRYTGALKNLKGCIPDDEKRRFHSLGLHEPIARLNQLLVQNCILMDGICGDPTYEEGGNPSQLNRLLFAFDPVKLDSYAAGCIGVDWHAVDYIRRAAKLGIGRPYRPDGSDLLEINRPENPGVTEQDPEVERLRGLIDERGACSSCFASLIEALKRGALPQGLSYAVGRSFRHKVELQSVEPETVGFGSCTAALPRCIPGCPPSPEDAAACFRSSGGG
jgi:uncharacterized protein (DUF362 family)